LTNDKANFIIGYKRGEPGISTGGDLLDGLDLEVGLSRRANGQLAEVNIDELQYGNTYGDITNVIGAGVGAFALIGPQVRRGWCY
jgi:hypothetical protein